VRVRVGAASDIGQVREGNEDSFLVEEPLFAVADGMGGHRGGEVASRLALETVQRLFEERTGSLTEQVEQANRAVFERSQLDRDVAGMGTTLTAALLEGTRVRLAHVGDSRAYLFRDGGLLRLTEDHTLVHRMVQEGEITEAEAETHPHRSILTRALGVDPAVHVDEGVLEVRAGDRLLLCTDGLTGMLPEDRIREVLEGEPDPQAVADRLVGEANAAGGVDNITVVLLDLEEGSEHDPPAETTVALGERGAGARTDGGDERRAEGVAPAPPVRRAAGPTRPEARAPARGRTRRLVGSAIAVAAIVLALIGVRLFLDSQWFVGISDGQVAIFRGVPAEVAGFELHSVVVETPIDAEDAMALALYRDLDEGITAADRLEAEEIVERIRVDVARARAGGP